MGLIEIKKGIWINAEAIEAIGRKNNNECIVHMTGSRDEYYPSDYTVEELIDLLEAHGVAIIPFKRPHAGDIINFVEGER